MQADIERFFRDYVAAFNRSLGESPDLDAIRAAFAPCFVAAGPTGVICGQNDEAFLEFLEQGYAFYRSIGTRSMTLLGVETTPIDANHEMARVFYSSEYERRDGGLVTIDFEVTYMLHSCPPKTGPERPAALLPSTPVARRLARFPRWRCCTRAESSSSWSVSPRTSPTSARM